MESKKHITSAHFPEEQSPSGAANGEADVMNVAQIQGLVRLLDGSDVSELEVKSARDGIHLVLRKMQAPEDTLVMSEGVQVASDNGGEPAQKVVKQHVITAHLVGVFHPWLKPRGGMLVAVGDRVKAGQLVGTIESLNVFNEVETVRAGRVVEIHVQDDQPVEYGQALITVECSEGEDDA